MPWKKCTTPPSAFQVQSAMSDISLVTHAPTMENTLGPIGITVIRLRHCGRKQARVPTGLIINMINKLTGQQTWKQSEAPETNQEKNETPGVNDNVTYCKSWDTQGGKEKRGDWKMQVAEPAEQSTTTVPGATCLYVRQPSSRHVPQLWGWWRGDEPSINITIQRCAVPRV